MTNLRQARKAHRLSQAELAEKVGCRQTFISSLERGYRPGRSAVPARIADVLGVSVDELFPPTH
jgi:transcriptional regulator with XRE-family HTH domain